MPAPRLRGPPVGIEMESDSDDARGTGAGAGASAASSVASTSAVKLAPPATTVTKGGRPAPRGKPDLEALKLERAAQKHRQAEAKRARANSAKAQQNPPTGAAARKSANGSRSSSRADPTRGELGAGTGTVPRNRSSSDVKGKGKAVEADSSGDESRRKASKAKSKAAAAAAAASKAGEDDSGAFSTTSDSSSASSEDGGNSSDEEEAAALEMDGQELWAQNYCAVCERLIQPGTGVTAGGVTIGINRDLPPLSGLSHTHSSSNGRAGARGSGSGGAGSGANSANAGSKQGGAEPNELKRAIDDAVRKVAANNANANATANAGGIRPPLLKRTSSGGSSRLNALSELKPAATNGPTNARHHNRTPSGGSTRNGEGGRALLRKSPAASRSSSLSRMTKAKKDKESAAAGGDGSEACSPVSPRSGIATPPGTGSGIARSKEEAKAARKRNRGSSLLGPLTPMLQEEQQKQEAARLLAAPAALYCSQACREMDEARSKDMSGLHRYIYSSTPQSPGYPSQMALAAAGGVASSFGPSNRNASSQFLRASSSTPAITPSASSLQNHHHHQQHAAYSIGGGITVPYTPGGMMAQPPAWAQMPYGPGSSGAGSSWQNQSLAISRTNSSWGIAGGGGTASGGSGSLAHSQAGSYPYPYGIYGYPPPAAASQQPGELAETECDCEPCGCPDCREAVFAEQAGRRSSSRMAQRNSYYAAKKDRHADNVSTVPSGASDTTESSGSHPAGHARAKKRTQSGRVETPLNLQPGQAASGDYFGGNHHLHQHHRTGSTGQHEQMHRHPAHGHQHTASFQSDQSRTVGSASTNATEDSTLSYWEAEPRRSKRRAQKDQSPSITAPASEEDFLRRSSSADLGLSQSSSQLASQSPLRLLKHRGSAAAVSSDLTTAMGAQPSASLDNASGFLSRSMASEHTELGTSATTTGTFNVTRSSTIRQHRPKPRRPGLPEAVAAEEDRTASAIVATTQAPAVSLQSQADHGDPDGTLVSARTDADGLSSAINSLRIAQSRASASHRGSVSSMWSGKYEDSESQRDSRRWSTYSDASQPGANQASSSGTSWWRTFVPAWASIKALQALNTADDSEDEFVEQMARQKAEARPRSVHSSSGGTTSSGTGSNLARPTARRAEMAGSSRAGSSSNLSRVESKMSDLSISPDAEDQRRRREEKSRSQRSRRSKDVHMLPPLLAPTRSSTNVGSGMPRASRAGSQGFPWQTPGSTVGSYGIPRSTTPGAILPPANHGAGSYAAPGMVPPSPGLRAMRSPARGSFANLPALGDSIMRPPSRTNSAMGMHVGSLSGSPRRAGLGWGPISQSAAAIEGGVMPSRPPSSMGPAGPAHRHRHHHPHHHHHHHAHHASATDLSNLDRSAGPSSYKGEEGIVRPNSGIGHRRPRSVYGSSYGANQSGPDFTGPPVMSALTRAQSGDFQNRTWSYERLPGLKTYPIMQLAHRKPTHDVYDNWNEVLTSNPLGEDPKEDPAEEARADMDERPMAAPHTERRQKLFYFDNS